ncbi:Cytosolic sulfotransferase 17 [Bienertia sinuspersici]
MASLKVVVSKTEGNMNEEMDTIVSSLPKEKGWFLENIYKYEGFWFEKPLLYGSLNVKRSFNAKPENVILATLPKAGTTWFCALLFTTINRTRYDYATHPLLTQSPHDCVPHIEYKVLKNPSNPTISCSTSPLVSTHIPYTLLPESVNYCNCKIIYVCRDPMDDFVSLFHYANKLRPQELQSLGVDEAFEMFCTGVLPFGSYWDHVLGYWNASLEMPNNVCFVKFEDMKKQPLLVLKKVAQFVGCPFTYEEEQKGVVQKIVDFCSFESLTSFQVNSTPILRTSIPRLNTKNNAFFRKGHIGDHKNYLTDDMINRLKGIIEIKFAGSGLDVFA